VAWGSASVALDLGRDARAMRTWAAGMAGLCDGAARRLKLYACSAAGLHAFNMCSRARIRCCTPSAPLLRAPGTFSPPLAQERSQRLAPFAAYPHEPPTPLAAGRPSGGRWIPRPTPDRSPQR
jgi:hypothetical protein